MRRIPAFTLFFLFTLFSLISQEEKSEQKKESLEVIEKVSPTSPSPKMRMLRYGFRDAKTGEHTVLMQYLLASPFSEGLASVAINTPWGVRYSYINYQNRFTIFPLYKFSASYSEGRGRVISLNDEILYMDRRGNPISNPTDIEIFDSTPFRDGKALVTEKSRSNKPKVSYLNIDGSTKKLKKLPDEGEIFYYTDYLPWDEEFPYQLHHSSNPSVVLERSSSFASIFSPYGTGFYQNPSTEALVLKQLRYADTLIIVEDTGGDWLQAIFEDELGWVERRTLTAKLLKQREGNFSDSELIGEWHSDIPREEYYLGEGSNLTLTHKFSKTERYSTLFLEEERGLENSDKDIYDWSLKGKENQLLFTSSKDIITLTIDSYDLSYKDSYRSVTFLEDSEFEKFQLTLGQNIAPTLYQKTDISSLYVDQSKDPVFMLVNEIKSIIKNPFFIMGAVVVVFLIFIAISVSYIVRLKREKRELEDF